MNAIDHLLLGVAVIAVGGASFRLASTFVDRGLERILVAATFFAGTIVLETMALALLGLGGSQIPLVIGAVVAGLVTISVVPPSGVRVSEELSGWLARVSTPAIVGVSTAIGIGAVWTAWSLWSPNVGAGATALWEAVEGENASLEGRGRVLVRASGTEPLVRVMVEAPDDAECEAVCSRLVGVVERELGSAPG